jgi:hypothetical protein
MMGLGLVAGFSITPIASGRVAAIIGGCCANSGANGGLHITGRYGSGTAPANGAAITGTTWSITQVYYMTSANDISGFTVIGGFNIGVLAAGTAYWFDVSISATGGGTVTITNVQSLLWEL